MRLRFGEFEFNSETGELWHGKTAIRVQPQPARVLALLIAQPGELVTREALQQHIWGEDTVVDFEQGLNWCIRRLREVLNDIPSEPRFIQTVPRRGYRFVGDVKVLEPLEKSRPLHLFCRPDLAVCRDFEQLGIDLYGPVGLLNASAELTSGLARRNPARLRVLSKVPVPVKADGLLGAEFLEQYVLRIDPVAHTIAFYDPNTFTYRGEGKSIPLELTNSRLYVHVGLAPKPGELVERKLRVDTGSEDSIDDDIVRNSPATQKTTLGNGLGTSYEDVSGVYDTVIIGPFAFHHVWGPAGAVPIIGMEMMRRFTLTFDAKRGLLYLEPNSNFNEPIPAPI
jgi:DNA-binding winged helix-turn-helix (wHTH) protein